MRSLKRTIVLIICISTIVPFASSQDQHNEKFTEGTDFYNSAGFQEALDIWMEIYNTGYRSASLAYNIGNAFFKLNDIPGAILFYERARLLKPADENINYNLQIARSLVVDKFEEIPELFFVKWFDFVSLVISSNGWAIISLISFVLFLLLFSLYLFSSRYRLKVTAFWAGLFFVILSLISLSLTLRNKSLVYDSRKAIVFNPSVSGKSSPDTSGTDLFIIHEGTKVTIEDTVGEWHEIRLTDGNKGWIPSGSVNII